MIFNDSPNTQAFLKAGIMGFAGSGKTFTAKEFAIGLHKMLAERKLAGGDAPVCFLDTETGADWVKPAFLRHNIKLHVAKTRAFRDLVPAIAEVAKSRGILIIDSITHFWRELTESYAEEKKRMKGLRFDDWAWLKKTWGDFTDMFINSTCHIIMCGRAGYEYDFFENDGKKELEKTGIKMKAETETGYEPSILILMERHQDITTDPISVWRSAVILKDRANLLDGKLFKNPTFGNFRPHIDFLNLGGEQLGIDTSRTSESLIPHEDRGWAYEEQQKKIALEEIEGVLVKHYPGQSAEHKGRKRELIEKHAGTLSWSAVESMPLSKVKQIRDGLYRELEGPKPETDVGDFLAASVENHKPAEQSNELPGALIDQLGRLTAILHVNQLRTSAPGDHKLSDAQRLAFNLACDQQIGLIRAKRGNRSQEDLNEEMAAQVGEPATA